MTESQLNTLRECNSIEELHEKFPGHILNVTNSAGNRLNVSRDVEARIHLKEWWSTIQLVVTFPNEYHGSVNITQQQGTCSIGVVSDFSYHNGNSAFLMKAAELVAICANYTKIRGAHLDWHEVSTIVNRLGFQVDEPYQNKRTLNNIVEFSKLVQ